MSVRYVRVSDAQLAAMGPGAAPPEYGPYYTINGILPTPNNILPIAQVRVSVQAGGGHQEGNDYVIPDTVSSAPPPAPPPAPGPTPIPSSIDPGQVAPFGSAFQRYLDTLQRGSGGVGWAEPMRDLAATQGNYLSNIAPLMRFGPTELGSGASGTYQNMFDVYGAGGPSRANVNSNLTDLLALDQKTRAAQDMTPDEQARWNAYQTGFGQSGVEGGGFTALLASMLSRTPTDLRSGLTSTMNDMYRKYTARSPGESWLSFAHNIGLF